MEELTQQITAIIVPAVIAAVGSLVALGVNELKKWIRSKTESEGINTAMNQISEITLSVVNEIEQDARKLVKNGKLTVPEAMKLKKLAIKRVREQLPKTVELSARAGVNELNKHIAGKVEEMVLVNKRMKATASPAGQAET